MPLKDGPSGAAHPSDSCAVVFTEIAVDLEGQLEMVSEVPEGFIRFSPDGRLPHTPSLIRTAALDKRCSGEGAGCEESSETYAAKPDRGPSSEASGRLAALVVSGVAPVPTPCSSSPALLGIPAASRKGSSPASHEARTLLGAGARRHQSHPPPGQASSRSPTNRRSASSPTSRPCRSTCTARREAHAHSRKKEFGVDPGVATTETGYTDVFNGGGSGGRGVLRLNGHAQVQRIPRTRHGCPGVIITAHETRVREDLVSLLWESWSWQRHAQEHLLHHCGHF